MTRPESGTARLEVKARGELHLSHVSRGRSVPETTGVCGSCKREGAVDGVDVGMVEDVEGFGAKLKASPFGDRKGLIHRGGKADLFGATQNAWLRVAGTAKAE